MSLFVINAIVKSKNSNRDTKMVVSHGSSSVAHKNNNIITQNQAYDNYFGKGSVQKEIKSTPIANEGFVHNTTTYNKQSGLLPKIAPNNEKKVEEKPRILLSRQKQKRKEKEDVYLMAQSQIRKNSEAIVKPQQSQIKNNQYLLQMSQEKEIPIKQSKLELDQIFKPKTLGLVGLNNIGNTCFMNSILQCMLNLPKFNDYFLQNMHSRQISSSSRVAYAYAKLVQLIKCSTSRSETPSDIKSAVSAKKPRFSGYGQQDAQQFLLALLQLLSIELNRSKNPKYKQLKADLTKNTLQDISEEWWSYNRERENSIVCDFFAGQILSKVICGTCSNESIAFDNTWDFCLNFSYNDSGDLLKMMENFLKQQTISQDYYCSKCKNFQECTRKLFLYRLPQILVLQIKRFSFGKFSKQKITNRIKVPVNLNLSKVILHNHHQSVKNPVYELIGVVNHSGEINYGHYTADCKNSINGKWYTFNDSSVSQIYMGEQLQSSNPYLLFYNKK